jgi:hypothetical protein
VVIDSPAQVSGPRIGSETPPGVFFGRRIELPEGIDQAGLSPIVHPGSFFGQKAGSVLMSFGVIDIYGLVANIKVSANQQIRTFFTQLSYKIDEIGQKFHFELLSHIAHTARGHIDTKNTEIAVIGSQYPAFAVVFVVVHAHYNAVGFPFG